MDINYPHDLANDQGHDIDQNVIRNLSMRSITELVGL